MLIRNFLTEQEVELLRTEIELQRDLGGMHYESDHGKTRLARSNYYEPFHKSITRRVSDIFGKPLVPTYDYTRIYSKGAILTKHRDRLSCQNSMTVCIYNSDEPWPFYVDHGDIEGISCFKMNPGDAVFYLGCVSPHWREPLKSGEVWQQFYHWISLNGPYMEHAGDEFAKEYNKVKNEGTLSKEALAEMRRRKDPDKKIDRVISYAGKIVTGAEVNKGEINLEYAKHHNPRPLDI